MRLIDFNIHIFVAMIRQHLLRLSTQHHNTVYLTIRSLHVRPVEI